LLDVPLEANVREQLRGVSLVPALRGEPCRRDVFSETDYRQYTYKRSIITPEDWKLIYTLENRTRELYNLERDPGEQDDVAGSHRELADQLERRLFDHFRSIGHDLTMREWKVGLNPVYPSQGLQLPNN
jgi:arylsulfatase A-like enzyme